MGMFYMHTWGHRLDDNLIYRLADGRASILFAVLAGVSVILLTKSRTVVQSLIQLIGRGVILTGIGLAISTDAVGPIVILVTYGFLYLLIAPLTFRLPLYALIPTAVAASVLAPLSSFVLRQDLPMASQFGDTPTFGLLVDGEWAQFFQLLFITGLFPLITWAPVFVWGMVAGRALFRIQHAAWWLAAWGAVLFAGAQTVSDTYAHRTHFFAWYSDLHPGGEPAADFLMHNAFGVTPPDTPRWMYLYVPHSGSVVEIFSSVGFSFLVIGICLLACSVPLLGVLTRPFSELGRMPLTAYVAHILAIGYLRGQGHDISEPGYAAANLLVPLVFAWLWFRIFRRGPLEAAMTKVLKLISPARTPRRA